ISCGRRPDSRSFQEPAGFARDERGAEEPRGRGRQGAGARRPEVRADLSRENEHKFRSSREPFRPRGRVIKAMPPVSPIRRAGAAVSPYRRARPPESNFEDLLRPQVEYLYRLAWRFTGGVADAEDLIQDVLIKLFPRTQQPLETERLRPWLPPAPEHHYAGPARSRRRSPRVEH